MFDIIWIELNELNRRISFIQTRNMCSWHPSLATFHLELVIIDGNLVHHSCYKNTSCLITACQECIPLAASFSTRHVRLLDFNGIVYVCVLRNSHMFMHIGHQTSPVHLWPRNFYDSFSEKSYYNCSKSYTLSPTG